MDYLKEGEKEDPPNELGTLKHNCCQQNSGVLLIWTLERREVLGILGRLRAVVSKLQCGSESLEGLLIRLLGPTHRMSGSVGLR